MKTLRQTTAQPKHLAVHLGSIATSILMVSLVPATALAAPPATVATCEGIKAAYPILGTQCQNNYADLNHKPANAADRLAAFKIRVTEMQIFRKALLCNGLYGAKPPAQQSFISGESGHLKQLSDLRGAMQNANDPTIPDEYTLTDLKAVTMNQAQCK